jgi:hypothetical protein
MTTEEEGMRELLPLVPIAIACLIVAALSFYSIRKEHRRS